MTRQWLQWIVAPIVVAALLSSALTAGAMYIVLQRDGVLAQATLPGIPNTGSESIPAVVASVNPSVVSIVVRQRLSALQEEFGGYYPYVMRLYPQGDDSLEVGGGSGFIVADGYVVTNRHVVSLENADYTVVTNDGEEHAATIVYRDADKDIAVMKIEGTYPALSLGDSDEIQIGQSVIAIGNALTEFQNTVSVGVISGLGRSIRAIDPLEGSIEELDEVIQTDAAINRGNSGGPLLDGAGKVIGMNVAVSANAQNIGFAIPANEIKDVLEKIK